MTFRILSFAGIFFATTIVSAQEAGQVSPEGTKSEPAAASDGPSSGPKPNDPEAEPPVPIPATEAAPTPAAPEGGLAAPSREGPHETELTPVVVEPQRRSTRIAQAKPAAPSGGGTMTSGGGSAFDADGELVAGTGIADGERLTALESSATSYAISESGTATKFELSPREIPQTVVVTTQKFIQDFHLTDVKQIFQMTPGLYVENERNVGAYQVFSRGYQLQVQLDGVPSALRIGDRDAISLDSAMIDRVEVLQGAAGLLTGAGAPGGTINVIRKMPTKNFGAWLDASVDTWEGGRLVGDISTPIAANGSVRARIVGVGLHNDTYIDEVYNDQGMFYGVVQADVTKTTMLTAGFNAMVLDGSNGAAYGIPAAHDGSDLRLPRELNIGADWAEEWRRSNSYFVKLDQELWSKWKFQAQLTQYSAEAEFLESSTYSSVDPKTGLGAGIWGAKEDWDTDSLGADLYLTGPVKLFGREHEIMAGMNGYQNTLWSLGYRETVDAVQWINVYNHNPNTVPGPFSLPWVVYGPNSVTDVRQYGGFAATRLNPLERAHVILGGRLTWYDSRIDGLQTINEDDVFTPYAGVVLDVTKWASVYASYTDIFQPNDPFLKDVAGNVLPPEVGVNREAGLKTEFFGGKLISSFAYFRIDHENLAELDPNAVPFSCNGNDCYRATGLVISQGFDFAIAGSLTKNLSVYGGYTYLDQVYATGENEGERYRPQTPANLFKMAMTYSIPRTKWTVGGNIQYRGEIWAEGVNFFVNDIPWRIEQDGVWLVGLMTKYQVTEKAYLLLNVENLFDEVYYSGISVPYHGQVYGDPRKVTLSLRKSF